MNDDVKRLQQQQRQDSQLDQQTGQSKALEFDSAEEVLRHDAASHQPPDRVVERLNESIAKEPKPPTSWWRKLLGS
ncbi:MAG: hypothetical protein AB1705_20685 [Verrucomicrobiota bacterium]